MSNEGWNNTRIYRYISSPVQGASVSDLQQEIPVTGSFTGASVCAGCTSNQSLFAYNEAVITDTDGNGIVNDHDGYVDFPNASNMETLETARGYAFFVRGNILASTLWNLRGPINAGNNSPSSFPVSYTSSGTLANDGWNLVGNPFPSTIDWNASGGWTKANIDASIYITDNGNSALQTATWNGVIGTNGGSRYISTGQGFWIKANGSGTPVLQATENIKAPGTQTAYIREGVPDNLLRITMVGGTTRDEAVIHFREGATEVFDTDADAIKLPNGTFNLSSQQTDGMKLAINSLSPLTCTTDIRLSVENAKTGIYQLNFSEFESFPNTREIILADAYANTSFDVRKGDYAFAVTSDPESYGSGRFVVSFANPEIRSDFIASAAAYCDGPGPAIQIDNSQTGVIYVASNTHGPLSPMVAGNGVTIVLPIIADSMVMGENSITVSSSWQGCSLTVEKEVTLLRVKVDEVFILDSENICREGVLLLSVSGASEGSHYNWYETESSSVPFDQHGPTFNTPVLLKSKTYFVSIINSSGCESERKPVLANVIQYEDAQINLSASGALLVSNFDVGNQWFLNGKPLPDATEQSLVPQLPGMYGLTVNVDGCSTHTEFEYVVTGIGDEEHWVKVFPNPVRKEVNIVLPDSGEQIKEIIIINGEGKVVDVIKPKVHEREGSIVYDMSGLPAAVYILRAISSSRVIELKLVKL
jgi:hypothetical protein